MNDIGITILVVTYTRTATNADRDAWHLVRVSGD